MTAKDILSRMTQKEKIALCSGASFWRTKDLSKFGVPFAFMCDGPHGLRKQSEKADMLGINSSRPATCFPAEVTMAGSWDEALLNEIGEAIGEEAKKEQVALVLGPGLNIKRNPLCGRNFEYFSEDPYVSGKLGAAFVRGVQKNGTGATIKHFAANSQETDRFVSDGVMDERTLREIYLPAFEIAVKEASPASVMCSYPKLNGVHLSDHKPLLNDILRDEWGFAGMVVTDWGAMNDRDYRSLLDMQSFGHDIEASWLMWDAVECMIPKEKRGAYRDMCIELSEAVYERAMTDHGLKNETVNGKVDETRIWWVQAETVLGFENAYALTGDVKYKKAYEAQWNAVQRMIVDPRDGGEWFWSVLENGMPTDKPIVEEWKCPYHNGRMCLRLMEKKSW